MLDDVVIDIAVSDTLIEHVALQVTLDLNMIASDDKYRAVIGASLFTHHHKKPYYYGFITQADTEALRRLASSAFTRHKDADKWLEEVNLPNNFDQDIRKALSHLKNALAPNMPNKQPPTAQELVDFLHRFIPITLHVGGETDEQGALMRTLLSARYGLSEADSQMLLDALKRTAEEGGRNRHSFTFELLKEYVTRYHGPWLTELMRGTTGNVADEVVAELLARLPSGGARKGDIAERALVRHAEAQERVLREFVVSDVGEAEQALRNGELARVDDVLRAARRPAAWDALTSADRARVALLEGRFAVAVADDLDTAKAKAEEAGGYHHSPAVTKLEAQILIEKGELDLAGALIDSVDAPWVAQLRAAISLLRGDSHAASAFLAQAPADVETHRLRALTALSIGNRNAALEEAEQGVALDSRNESMRHAFGVVALNCAFLAGMPAIMGAVPSPVPPPYVRHDTGGREFLRSAAASFALMSRALRSRAYRVALNAWHFAALAADGQQRDEAERLLKTILADDPAEAFVIDWAELYAIPFDRVRATNALRVATADTSGGLDQVHTLVGLYITGNQNERAAELLQRYKARFDEAGARILYQLLESDVGLRRAHDQPEVAEKDRRAVLTSRAMSTGDWTPLVGFLRDRYRQEPSSAALLQFATALRSAQMWDELASLSSDLIMSGSVVGASYALQGLYNANRISEYARSYADVRDVFDFGQQRPQFARAYASSLERLGRLRESIDAWGHVVNELSREERPDAYIAMLRLYAALADVSGVRIVAQHLLSSASNATTLLAAASLAAPHARESAIRLWRSAVRDLPDNAAPAALGLGYRLGLDAEPAMEQLTRRIVKLSEDADTGVERVRLDDLRDKMLEWRQAAEAGLAAYARGEVPVHALFSSVLRGAMSDLWDDAFMGRSHLFLRFAGRANAFEGGDPVTAPILRIGLDVSAILTLHYLGVLDRVLDDMRVVVAPGALAAIAAMRERVAPAQPVAMSQKRRLLERIRGKDILSVNDRPEGALSIAADDDPNALARLVGEMQRAGIIVEAAASVLQRVGLNAARSADTGRLGDSVFLDLTAAMLLEAADVLRPLARHRATYISKAAEEVLTRMVGDDDDRQRRDSMLADLQSTLIPRIEGRLVPESFDDPGDDPLSRGLTALVRALDLTTDLLVVDDRVVSSFIRTDRSAQIATTYELTRLLWSETDAPLAKRVEAQLRRAKAFFLPVTASEVVDALAAAPLGDSGSIVETSLLEELRKYIAETIARRELLRKPINDPKLSFPFGETPHLMELSRVVSGALCELWRREELDEGRRVACADWILEQLYVDDLPELHITRLLAPERSDAEVVATGLAMLVYRAIDLLAQRDLGQSYFSYLASRLFRYRLQVDPDVAPALASHIGDACRAAVAAAHDRGDDADLARLLMHRMLIALPPQVQDIISSDEDLRGLLGLQSVESVLIDNIRFDATVVWDAIASVVESGERRSILSLAPLERWQISMDGHVVRIESKGRRSLAISDPALSVLRAGIPERNDFLRSVASTFDVGPAAQDSLFEYIAAARSPAEFMSRLSDARAENVGLQATILAEQAIQGRISRDGTIAQDVASILTYLRLPAADTDMMGRLDAGAEILVLQFGLEEALRRFFLLPVALPPVLYSSWLSTKETQRAAMFDRLYATSITPLDRAHLRRLADAAGFARRRSRIRDVDSDLLELRDGVDVAAQLSVIDWVRRVLSLHSEERALGSRADMLIAAWIFGSLTYREMRRRNVVPMAVRDAFREMAKLTERRFFGEAEAPAADPSHSEIDVVAHLFAYAYNDSVFPISARTRKGWASFFSVGKSGSPFPRVGVIAWRQAASVSGTFLGDDLRPTLRKLLPQIAAAYDDNRRREILDAVLSRLDDDPEGGLMWALLPMLRDLVIEPDVERLRRALTRMDFERAIATEPGRQTLFVAFATPRLLSSDDHRRDARQKLLDAAATLALAEPINRRSHISDDDRQKVAALHECAMRVALNTSPVPRLQAQAYVALARELGNRWNKSLRVIAPHIIDYSKTLPLAQSAPFGALILDCRRLG